MLLLQDGRRTLNCDRRCLKLRRFRDRIEATSPSCLIFGEGYSWNARFDCTSFSLFFLASLLDVSRRRDTQFKATERNGRRRRYLMNPMTFSYLQTGKRAQKSTGGIYVKVARIIVQRSANYDFPC